MCGIDKIYDGSFQGTLEEGDGIFASLLKRKGFEVVKID